MAAEQETPTVEFKLAEDVFKLVRTQDGVQFWAEGNMITPNLDSAALDMETLEMTFMGRKAGKLDVNVSQEKNQMDVETMKGKVDAWFPPIPSKVKHVHSAEEFEQLTSSGFVVCKWSTEWCGPCKAVAPKIAKLSTEYEQTTFLHIDCDELKPLAQQNGVKCYPTFTFWKDGQVMNGVKVEGGRVPEIVAKLDVHGGQKSVAMQEEKAAFEGEETLHIIVAGDEFKFVRADGKTSIAINGDVKAPDYPREIKLDAKTRSFVIGRQRYSLAKSYSEEEVEGFVEAMKALWPKMPSNVVHIHSEAEFDQLKSECPKMIAKFSADWCGPCHAIAPAVDRMSMQHTDLKFVHVDVDENKGLSGREGVQAMPTFHFYLNGNKMEGMMVRGANEAALTKNVLSFKEM